MIWLHSHLLLFFLRKNFQNFIRYHLSILKWLSILLERTFNLWLLLVLWLNVDLLYLFDLIYYKIYRKVLNRKECRFSFLNKLWYSILRVWEWCECLLSARLATHMHNRWIFCDVICLHWPWTVIHLPSKTKRSEYWKNKITLSSRSSDFESDISSNTYLAQFWKLKILQILYELSVTQPSSKFWKSL